MAAPHIERGIANYVLVRVLGFQAYGLWFAACGPGLWELRGLARGGRCTTRGSDPGARGGMIEYIYIYIYIYIQMYVYIYIYIYIYIGFLMCVYIFVYMSMYLYTYMYVCYCMLTYIYACVCVYIYIYVGLPKIGDPNLVP